MNVEAASRLIRSALIKGAKSVKGHGFSISELMRLTAKVFEADPTNPEGFAFQVGRNAAIDRQRREAYALRLRERERREASEEFVRAKAAWQSRRDLEAAREQFASFVDTLPASAPQCATRDEQLETVRLFVLEGCTFEEIAPAFPDVTLPQLWQWKRRGLKLLLAHNPPPELRRVLERSTLSKT